MITPELKHLRLVFANQDKPRIIRKLHRIGALHIAEAEVDGGFNEDSSLPEAETVGDLLLSFSYIQRVTGANPKTSISELPRLQRSVEEAQHFLDTHIEDIKALEENRSTCQETIENIEEQLNILNDIPDELTNIHNPILFKSQRDIHVEGTRRCKDGPTTYHVITADGIDRAQQTKQLINSSAQRIDLSYVTTTIEEAKTQLTSRLTEKKDELAKHQESIEEKKDAIQPKYAYLHTTLQAHYDELTLPNKFQTNQDITVIEAYCEPGDLPAIKRDVDEATIHVDDADEAPTKLKENGFNKAFRTITSMFDTPAYGSFDPTGFVTFFYPLFFGFMLSDIGYAFLVLLSMLLIQHLFGDDAKPYLNILGVSAISTFCFGILFGSFFGELIPLEPLWTTQFDASFTILIVALIIGLIHINIGVAINLYQLIKQGKPLMTVLRNVLPFPLVEAASISIYYGQTTLGITALAVSTSLLVWRDGFIGVLGLSDYLGTWFSYARLLALNLATAGIALAVNLIATKLLAAPIIGSLLYLITLVLGHTFNYAINVLGTTINAARLHYVEFFDLFFQGGGTPFNAFKLP